jgi:hypothetical protein
LITVCLLEKPGKSDTIQITRFPAYFTQCENDRLIACIIFPFVSDTQAQSYIDLVNETKIKDLSELKNKMSAIAKVYTLQCIIDPNETTLNQLTYTKFTF